MNKLLLLFITQFLHCTLAAQDEQALYATIDSIVVKHKQSGEIPAFAITVLINKRVAFEKTYGIARLKSKKKIGIHSDFHMASVSKPFTATAIMQLVYSGKLNLDSSLCYYLPYFKMDDDRYRRITLRHILTHSSGIPDAKDWDWGNQQLDDGAAERYVRSFTNQRLDFSPGSAFAYCSASFDMLADVIAKVSGMTFEKYIRRNIFLPLGMQQSSFFLKDISDERRTTPHVKDSSGKEIVSKIYPYNRIHAPSSTLHSNLPDLQKWMELWLNKGSIKGVTVLDSASWQDMLIPRGELFPGLDICLGWVQITVDGRKIYCHAGHDIGYRTFVGFDPEHGHAVVLMGNNDLFDPGEPAVEIFKAIFAKSPK